MNLLFLIGDADATAENERERNARQDEASKTMDKVAEELAVSLGKKLHAYTGCIYFTAKPTYQFNIRTGKVSIVLEAEPMLKR